MFPTLDHRKVYWWGEKTSLSVIDLDTLKATDYPMALGTSGAKLVTYAVLIINQKLIYIMSEDDEYKMVYYYDLLKNELTGTWDYSNDECKTTKSLKHFYFYFFFTKKFLKIFLNFFKSRITESSFAQ